MLGGIPLARILGMAAGLLILVVGIFVLRAKPHSRLHQLFFALAIADGVSTFAYDLGISPAPEFVRLHAILVYYYAFILFIGLLFVFGLRFPRPMFRGRADAVALGAVAALVLSALFALALDYTLIWEPVRVGGALGVQVAAGGQLLISAFILATALVIVRATALLRRETSPSHRRQGALVLGGLALGYVLFPTTNVIFGLRDGAARSFLSPDLTIALSFWSSLVALACIVAAAILISIERRSDRRPERNIVLASFACVIVLTILSIPDGSRATADKLQVLGVLAYPILLGYAIIRYEVLDIDAHMRRAATVSLLGAGATAAFLLFEVFLEQTLQRFLSAGISATLVAGIIAALLTALISVPLIRIARKLAKRVAPGLAASDVDVRKREIYRHALHGAAADGVIAPQELRVLQRLRESLQISDAEHGVMMREIGFPAGVTGS